MKQVSVYELVNEEMERQRLKYGKPELTPVERLAILVEEVGEVAGVISQPLDDYHRGKTPHWVTGTDSDALRKELVQVAAVVCAWLSAGL